MKAGIFAAGRGTRLRRPGGPLKPLVEVNGRALLEHVLAAMAGAGAEEVVVIINEESRAVQARALQTAWPFTLRWIVESTPSSMHSFLRLVETLAADGAAGPFLLSTVDTVAGADVYAPFLAAAATHSDADVVLALTDPGADEKPLFVRLNAHRQVQALGAAAAPAAFATAGIYAVRATILREAAEARAEGIDALRIFLGRLLERGYRIAGIPIAQTIDVDRPADIEIAEAFLRGRAQ